MRCWGEFACEASGQEISTRRWFAATLGPSGIDWAESCCTITRAIARAVYPPGRAWNRRLWRKFTTIKTRIENLEEFHATAWPSPWFLQSHLVGCGKKGGGWMSLQLTDAAARKWTVAAFFAGNLQKLTSWPRLEFSLPRLEFTQLRLVFIQEAPCWEVLLPGQEILHGLGRRKLHPLGKLSPCCIPCWI